MTYHFRTILIFLLLLINTTLSLRDIQCYDPDLKHTQNKNRKFILFGSEGSQGAGIGNVLIFFPAIYYYAAFSGRDIIIGDGSIVGEMCKIITCGFPFASEMALAYPAILGTKGEYKKAPYVKVSDFIGWMEETRVIDAAVVHGAGYKSESEWYTYFNISVHCVKKITGCDLGDVGCSDRHAYQRLIRGPFKAELTVEEEKRIKGVPDNIKHAILSLPHAYAPRLDAAVHIRNSFNHFEQQANITDEGYKKEVNDWLNSTECVGVFENLKQKVIEQMKIHQLLNIQANNTDVDPFYVYLAADNEQVKEAFEELLIKESHNVSNMTLNIMRVETKFVQHIKNLAHMKADTNNEGMLDIVFDWYSLSLANTVIAWRKGSTNFVSTFVHSAQRVSGTTERTNLKGPVGHGVGTIGYQLVKNGRWELMWAYAFLEDYAI